MKKVFSIIRHWVQQEISLAFLIVLLAILSIPTYAWYGPAWLQSILYPDDSWRRWAMLTLFFGGIWIVVALIQKWMLKGPEQIPWILALLGSAVYSARESITGYQQWFIGDSPEWDALQFRCAENVMEGLFIFIPIGLYYFTVEKDKSGYGLYRKGFDIRPYAIMLGLMVIPVTWAAWQSDFLNQYPKAFQGTGITQLTKVTLGPFLAFEACYGFDFVSIEFFFRGFLIMGFARLMGRKAIIPMAAWYMMIHLGKPLGETLSSFLGGSLLGLLAFETRNIYGGIMVHLGIAWLMEFLASFFHAIKWGS